MIFVKQQLNSSPCYEIVHITAAAGDITETKSKTNVLKLFPHHLGIWGNCPVHLELNYHTTTPTSLSGMSDQEEHDNDG